MLARKIIDGQQRGIEEVAAALRREKESTIMKTLHRTLTPVTKVLDEKQGLVEYIASDESVDSDREIVRSRGWRFDHMKGQMPLMNSHRHDGIEHQLGKVVEYEVRNEKLYEVAQWAIDVPENKTALLGFKMIAAGYGGRVSVGFVPEVVVGRDNRKAFHAQLAEINVPNKHKAIRIYDGQQQIELSAVIVGSNLNAVAIAAKAYKAGVLTDDDLDLISKNSERPSSAAATHGAPAAAHRARHRQQFLAAFEIQIKRI